MKTCRFLAALALAVFACCGAGAAYAQNAVPTDNHSRSIATGNTYQVIAPNTGSRRTLEIQNNNTSTDNCWIDVTGIVPQTGATTTTNVTTADGVTLAASQASVLLTPGQSYTRYYPYTPAGAIVGTCAGTGDSIYVDAQ